MSVYDVTLFWHSGGSLFLGTIAASDVDAAGDAALEEYMRNKPGRVDGRVVHSAEKYNKARRKLVEESGAFQLDAQALSPGDAARWIAAQKNAQR